MLTASAVALSSELAEHWAGGRSFSFSFSSAVKSRSRGGRMTVELNSTLKPLPYLHTQAGKPTEVTPKVKRS